MHIALIRLFTTLFRVLEKSAVKSSLQLAQIKIACLALFEVIFVSREL